MWTTVPLCLVATLLVHAVAAAPKGTFLDRLKVSGSCQELHEDNSSTSRPPQYNNICLLSPETGPCRARIIQFYYNATTGTCEEFIYGGCRGNDNRFDSQQQCQDRCSNSATDLCFDPPETGPCKAYQARFFYNATSGQCEKFIYGGCQGNDNRFDSQQQCQERCSNSATDLCFDPPETGPCKAYQPSYFYNATSGQCEKFIYGGCSGNNNRFKTEPECRERCQDTITNTADICNLPASSGNCLAYIEKFHFNSTSGQCEIFVYGGCGGNNNRFDTQQKCQETCEDISPNVYKKICYFPPDSGLCDGLFPKYFYNSTSQNCEKFNYGACGGNDNRFDSEIECQRSCS